MLKIAPKYVLGLRQCTAKEDLYFYLQKAVELEHATIPPYLTAMYSLIPGRNDEISAIIRSVVVEEMLHMTIAANILIAIGGRPTINQPGFIPKYPGPLPMSIGDGLIVPIKAFSKDVAKNVFMAIEAPEDPIEIRKGLLGAADVGWHTIGQFYQALQEKICELGDGSFTVGAEEQVLSWFDPKENFPIVDANSAVKAIEVIVNEGEGTSTSPFVPQDPKASCEDIIRAHQRLGKGHKLSFTPPVRGTQRSEEVAHYYLFEEIYEGRKIESDGQDGYAFSGPEIPFDEEGVYPMIENPSQDDYPPGSMLATLSNSFSYGYSNLLNSLHESFNGNPNVMKRAIGLMYQLKLDAQKLMAMPISPDSNQTAGPVFRYITTNPSPVH